MEAIFLIVLWIILPSSIIPSPLEIAVTWNQLALHNGLLPELVKSITRIWEAIFYSTLISFGIAFLSTSNIFKAPAMWITALRFLGFSGITFLFTIWTKDANGLSIALLTFGMTVFLVTNAVSMVDSISQEQIDYCKTLRFSGFRISYELIFRERLDEIIDLIRQNAAIGLAILSMVESLNRADGGIAALLLSQNKGLNLSIIFAIQITIFCFGLLQDKAFQIARITICPYVKYSSGK